MGLTRFLVGFLHVCCFWFTIFPDFKPKPDLQVNNHCLPNRYFYYDWLPSFCRFISGTPFSVHSLMFVYFVYSFSSHPHPQHLTLCVYVPPSILTKFSPCLAQERSLVAIFWPLLHQAQSLAHSISFLTHKIPPTIIPFPS